MAKHTESVTAARDSDPEQLEAEPLTRPEARDRFINRCLYDWGHAQFLGERACRPEPGHVDTLAAKAGKLFDVLFDKRPITPNLR